VEGIDFSKSMVSIAQRKNRKHIRDGKVKIYTGDFNDISFCDSAFDAVFTVNTIYFWENPEFTIAKICRILKPGGQVLIGFNGKKEMGKKPLDKDVFRYYTSEDVVALLSGPDALEDIHITSVTGTHKTGYCAVGIKQLEK
jgi:ubiquinone/menaquinone biosynthesis C-methylase UbiE